MAAPSWSSTFLAVTRTCSTFGAHALALIACAAAVSAQADPALLPASRDRLRFIVQQECLPHWRAAHDPAPCVSVDAAWQSREVLSGSVGRAVPRAAVGLAVNQRRSRSQDQLHIHISCVRAEVARALRSQAGAIGNAWSAVEIAGYRYEAMRIMGEHLSGENPFELLARTLPGSRCCSAAWISKRVPASCSSPGVKSRGPSCCSMPAASSWPERQTERTAQFRLLLSELRHVGGFSTGRRGDLASNFAWGGRLFS